MAFPLLLRRNRYSLAIGLALGLYTVLKPGAYVLPLLLYPLLLFLALAGLGVWILAAMSVYVVTKGGKSAFPRKDWHLRVAPIAKSLLIVCTLHIVGTALGTWRHSHEIDKAQEFVEGIVPGLDRIRANEGTYPDSLGLLAGLKKVRPHYLKTGLRYSGDSSSFSFEFADPDGFFSGDWYYRSDSRRWSWRD